MKALASLGIGIAVAAPTCYAVMSGSEVQEIIKTILEVTGETYTSGKFGNEYSELFLAVTGNHNNKVWGRKLNSLINPSNSGFFKDVTGDNKKIENLKNACKAAYQENTPTNSEDKWNEVWKYCFAGDEKPVTIDGLGTNDPEKKKTDSSGEWNNKLGATKKTELISLSSPKNKDFWDRRNQKSVLNTDKFFHKKKEQSKTIKESCEEAYKLTSVSASSDSAPSEAEVLKYCSIKKSS